MGYFPISDTGAAGVGQITPYQMTTKRGYFEARNIYRDVQGKLKDALGNLTAEGSADNYMVVSMGDEIALSVPSGAWGQQQFEQWLKTLGYPNPGKFNATLCYDVKACNPCVHSG
jgi:hypothetical protein